MPTSPVWSNLLLGKSISLTQWNRHVVPLCFQGDLNRHRRRIVRSFEKLTVTAPEQRTTVISERRMGILKRTQLGKMNP